MGAASPIMLKTSDPPVVIEEDADDNKSIKSNSRKIKNKTRQRIFDVQENSYDLNIESLLNGDSMDETTRNFLMNSLKDFFFLQSSADDIQTKMDLLLRGMKKEEKAADELLIIEGESGTKLFVVEMGTLVVTINGTTIREMTKGAIVGELALLYDAPRSATVQCKTRTVVWSLSREIFKKIQAVSANANQIQRARWLVAAPELAILSAIDLSRLVGTLHVNQFNTGDKLFTENELSNTIYLVESGDGLVYTSKNSAGSVALVDKTLGILRPREGKRKSVANMTAGELGKYLQGYNEITNNDQPSESPPSVEKPTHACEVYDGCIIGLGALRGKANMPDSWQWKAQDAVFSHGGAISPLTLVAKNPMTCLSFTVDVFENLFGSAEKILLPGMVTSKNGQQADEAKPVPKEIQFDSTKFKAKYVLGSGSFGVVTLAEYKTEKSATIYALKSLSKLAVIETGQLRHVIDERKILAIMDHVFILRLYGTYQTPHQLVMVTEPLSNGDLWSIIYETPQFSDHGGIPWKLTAYYAAALVLALDHIHAKGVVYRDLKPENIMVDHRGFLRVIDFGFAKRVPFTKPDSNGQMKVYNKTYTLCGTPEYLSPELIFNLGHNHGSDVWALGVIIYEMLMTVTPFAPKRPDNVTELFTNIAMVKKNGLVLSSKLNQQCKCQQGEASSLISSLLKADPAERIGVKEGSTKAIIEHPFFKALGDVTTLGFPLDRGLEEGKLTPEYIPQKSTVHDPLSNLPQVRPFNGDQSLFKDF